MAGHDLYRIRRELKRITLNEWGSSDTTAAMKDMWEYINTQGGGNVNPDTIELAAEYSAERYASFFEGDDIDDVVSTFIGYFMRRPDGIKAGSQMNEDFNPDRDWDNQSTSKKSSSEPVKEKRLGDDHMVVLPVMTKVVVFSDDDANKHGIEISLFGSDNLTQTLPCATREAAETIYNQIFALNTDEYNDQQKITMVQKLFKRMKLI